MCPQICYPQAEVLCKAEVNILMPSLKLPNLGAHTRGTFEKHAHFGGSCPPLEFNGCVVGLNQLVGMSAFVFAQLFMSSIFNPKINQTVWLKAPQCKLKSSFKQPASQPNNLAASHPLF
jgi:hypothetical protein